MVVPRCACSLRAARRSDVCHPTAPNITWCIASGRGERPWDFQQGDQPDDLVSGLLKVSERDRVRGRRVSHTECRKTWAGGDSTWKEGKCVDVGPYTLGASRGASPGTRWQIESHRRRRAEGAAHGHTPTRATQITPHAVAGRGPRTRMAARDSHSHTGAHDSQRARYLSG